MGGGGGLGRWNEGHQAGGDRTLSGGRTRALGDRYNPKGGREEGSGDGGVVPGCGGGGAAPTQSLGGGAGLPLDVSVLQAAELLLQAGDALALLRHEGSQRRHLLQHLVQPPARLRTGHAISAVTGAPPTPPKATPTRQVTCLKEHAPSTIALIKSHAHPPNDHAPLNSSAAQSHAQPSQRPRPLQ